MAADEYRLEHENKKFSDFGEHVVINVRNIFDVPISEERVTRNAMGMAEYQGWAIIGSAESEAVWLISKIIFDSKGRMIARVWANGEDTFDKVWDSKDTYNYSY